MNAPSAGWHPNPDEPDQPAPADETHRGGRNPEPGPALDLWASALASLHNSTNVNASGARTSTHSALERGRGRGIGATSAIGNWFTRHKVASGTLGLLATLAVIGLVAPTGSQPDTPTSAAASPSVAPDNPEPARPDPRVAAFLGAGLSEPNPAELRALEKRCTRIRTNDASALSTIAALRTADRATLHSKLEIVCPDEAGTLTAALADPDGVRAPTTDDRDSGEDVSTDEDVAAAIPDVGGGGSGTVTRIIDGDTVEVAGHGVVRVIGMDTPERLECGYNKASQAMSDLVLGKTVTLVPGARNDQDPYGRLLRYLDVGNTDAGLALIHRGLAVARYDSRDGFGAHPREQQYVAADDASPDATADACRAPALLPPVASGNESAPGTEPWNRPGPDLDCADIGRSVLITGPDYHRLDGDGDGIGCDSYL